ncbi:MAG: hypothetical protein P8Y53_10420 [Pseudolabrys sp.]
MPRFPWKTALAGAALLAAGTAFGAALLAAGTAFGAQLTPGAGPMQPYGHGPSQEMQAGPLGPMSHMNHMGMHSMGMHGGFAPHAAMNVAQPGATAMPTMPGQEAFGTIQEIVRILEADPSTDWSKVDIAALREHLIDMDEVTMHAAAQARMIDGGIEFTVTGAGRALPAIKRMVPAHAAVLRSLGWKTATEELPDGVRLTVMASEAEPLVKLKALGFIGIMAQGAHHQRHHLMMAKGEMRGMTAH